MKKTLPPAVAFLLLTVLAGLVFKAIAQNQQAVFRVGDCVEYRTANTANPTLRWRKGIITANDGFFYTIELEPINGINPKTAIVRLSSAERSLRTCSIKLAPGFGETPTFSKAGNTSQIATPSLTSTNRTRLAEAFRLGDKIGDRVWPEWSKAPFAVLLVTPDNEFLIRHPKPTPDFTKLGYDALLKSDVYYRKRTFPTHYLATFPAIRGSTISVIVMGQAENTYVKTSMPWVITLLHEHFHQLQDSRPNFYADVAGLNLSHGDQTGMWMLNYAFPYHRKEVQDQFALMSKLLADAIHVGNGERAAKVRVYLEARQKFQAMLAPDDYKYISFQFWKEGIARYTEYQVGRLAATQFRPSKEFRALKDYQSFADLARKTHERIFQQLREQQLGESKREVVYSFGAAEGLLLDQVKPGWRRRYFVEKFDLAKFW